MGNRGDRQAEQATRSFLPQLIDHSQPLVCCTLSLRTSGLDTQCRSTCSCALLSSTRMWKKGKHKGRSPGRRRSEDRYRCTVLLHGRFPPQGRCVTCLFWFAAKGILKRTNHMEYVIRRPRLWAADQENSLTPFCRVPERMGGAIPFTIARSRHPPQD